MPKTKKTFSRLIIASSESNADLLYATNFFVPDEMTWFTKNGKTFAVLSPLEIDRARRKAKIDHLICFKEAERKLQLQKTKKQKPSYIDVIASILKEHDIKSAKVPSNFPLAYAKGLKEKKIKVSLLKKPFFPEREIKTEQEISYITTAQRLAELGMKRAFQILREAKIDTKNFIIWNHKRLTSEILRGEIDASIIKNGGLPAHTIVACGNQACDPHEPGHGPLRAHQTIIIDIFPRHQKTGYFGDLTRTVVKGKASVKIRHLYNTVLKGQKIALDTAKAGVDGSEIHQNILNFFTVEGYPTEQKNGRWRGFFHGTGHSLGLEIHEAPRFGESYFKSNQAMTIEPGLYYYGLGGVRIEDLVIITEDGIKNLTRCPKFLEIN